MKTICVFNQKGGVGKTTTNINICSYLAMQGFKVLAIDIDPQGNTTSGLGIDKRKLDKSIYDLLTAGEEIETIIMKSELVENLYVVPATMELAGAEVEIIDRKDRDYILKNEINKIRDKFDYIFIDCPPSLGVLTINALVASHSVLIPIQCEYYALEGVSQLMGTIKLVKSRLNPNLDIQGVVLSMFDGRANLSIQVVDEVKRYFKGSVYTTLIPRNVRLAEAPSHGKPVIYYDSKCKGAVAYMELAEEFIDLEEDII